MKESTRSSIGSKISEMARSGGAFQKIALIMAKPKAVFAFVLSGILVASALIVAIVAVNGGDGKLVNGLRTFAGWNLTGWSSSTTFTRDSSGWTTVNSMGCPTTVPSGQWQGCYYRHYGSNFFDSANFLMERKDSAINFDWMVGSPALSVPVDNFSAKWEGTFSFESAEYTFSLKKDDGMRVYVDGVRVFDRFYNEQEKNFSFKRLMTSGSHRVKVEYFETSGNAIAQLQWVKSSSVSGNNPFPSPTPSPTPTSVTPYGIFTPALNDGSGPGYGVVSYCSANDSGRKHLYNVESNVPFGVRLLEGTYNEPAGAGGYMVASGKLVRQEYPDLDGKYRIQFYVDGAQMVNKTAIKFGIFAVADSREIGNERGATSRNDDCANYSMTITDKFCYPSGFQLNVKLVATNAEAGKQGYMVASGPGIVGPSRADLSEVTPGNYELSFGLSVNLDGNYKFEYYFNNYLRQSFTESVSVSGCGPIGYFNDRGAWGYNICDGEFKDVTVEAFANRPGRVADVQNNTVFNLTQQGSQYYGSGTYRLSSKGATLFLTLFDGTALTPIAADQTTFVITQDGCAGAVSLFSAPSTVEICSGEMKAVNVSATSTVPTRIFVNGLNYTNARISGSASTSPMGSFNATLGAGDASTSYTLSVLDNNAVVLHTQQVEAVKSSNCAPALSGELSIEPINTTVCPADQAQIALFATATRPGYVNVGSTPNLHYLASSGTYSYGLNKSIQLSPGVYTIKLLLQDSPAVPAVAVKTQNVVVSGECAQISGLTDIFIMPDMYGNGTGVTMLYAKNMLPAGGEVLQFHADGSVYYLGPGEVKEFLATVSIGFPRAYKMTKQTGETVESFTLTAHAY